MNYFCVCDFTHRFSLFLCPFFSSQHFVIRTPPLHKDTSLSYALTPFDNFIVQKRIFRVVLAGNLTLMPLSGTHAIVETKWSV